ncbi:protein kinase domain-containing protein [Nocardia grenadensis]
MEGVEGTEFGRYRLLDPLGAGAMGEVHRAYDTGTERMVAVKVLSREFAQDTVYRRRFQREAQLVARLDEPHIVPIHDFGEIDGRLFLEMRLVEAPNLASLLADRGALPAAEAVAVVTQIAAALDAAHASGVVHRDVKPSNILITASGFAYLIDFGIARSSQDTTLTRAGTMIGTLAYMAPERLTLDQVDSRSDVYSLACVLYECLAGTKPYTGESVERQIAAHLTDRPPLPSAAGLPPAFDAVVARGLAKDPDQRYGSAGELASAARQALDPAGSPGTGTSAAVTAPVDDPSDDYPEAGAAPGTDWRVDNSPVGTPPTAFGPPDSGPDVTAPAATPLALFPSATTPPAGLAPSNDPLAGPSPKDHRPAGGLWPDNNAPGTGFSPDNNRLAGFSPGEHPRAPGFSPATYPAAPPADRPTPLGAPGDIPPGTRSRTRAKTAAAAAALVTAVVSVSALALTREDTTTVTDAPVPTAPSKVSATAVPGDRAAEVAPAPASELPGQEPTLSETRSMPVVPSAPPAVSETTIVEHVPTTPQGDPVDEQPTTPPKPPLPTTSVAAPPTTTTVEPTASTTSPTTTTDPGTSTTTPSPGETTTTPPETTGTGEETSAAANSATTEQPRTRGSAISSSGHVPATVPASSPAALPPTAASGPAATATRVSPSPDSAEAPVSSSAPVPTSTIPASTRLPAPPPAPAPSSGPTSTPAPDTA